MTETQAIIDAYKRASLQNQRGALATVVRVEGSAYRRPGVRMFITETGETTGFLSGGCLERDVSERAAKVIRTGEPAVVTYDTTSDEDIVFGLGLGCHGIVQVLIEPTDHFRLQGLIELLAECSESARSGAVATVIYREGTEVSLGSRAQLYPDDSLESDLFLSEMFLGPILVDDMRMALQSGVSTVQHYDVDEGSIVVFLEVIEPAVRLVIFGAGDDALHVVALARELGWHTTVVDTRARPKKIEVFAGVDLMMLCRPEEVSERISLTERTAVVLMTHNYLQDLELLKTLLSSELSYVGCLGPKRRAESLISEMADGDENLAAAYASQLHAPVGLDIGAETPVEIALSIVAEIKAVLTSREGGRLRNRIGAIHSRKSKQRMHARWPVEVVANSVVSELQNA